MKNYSNTIYKLYNQHKQFFLEVETIIYTYGSFILINVQQVKYDTMMHANPTPVRSVRFNFGVDLLLVKSNITNPKPPMLNRKLDAKPSIMYCPLTL